MSRSISPFGNPSAQQLHFAFARSPRQATSALSPEVKPDRRDPTNIASQENHQTELFQFWRQTHRRPNFIRSRAFADHPAQFGVRYLDFIDYRDAKRISQNQGTHKDHLPPHLTVTVDDTLRAEVPNEMQRGMYAIHLRGKACYPRSKITYPHFIFENGDHKYFDGKKAISITDQPSDFFLHKVLPTLNRMDNVRTVTIRSHDINGITESRIYFSYRGRELVPFAQEIRSTQALTPDLDDPDYLEFSLLSPDGNSLRVLQYVRSGSSGLDFTLRLLAGKNTKKTHPELKLEHDSYRPPQTSEEKMEMLRMHAVQLMFSRFD